MRCAHQKLLSIFKWYLMLLTAKYPLKHFKHWEKNENWKCWVNVRQQNAQSNDNWQQIGLIPRKTDSGQLRTGANDRNMMGNALNDRMRIKEKFATKWKWSHSSRFFFYAPVCNVIASVWLCISYNEFHCDAYAWFYQCLLFNSAKSIKWKHNKNRYAEIVSISKQWMWWSWPPNRRGNEKLAWHLIHSIDAMQHKQSEKMHTAMCRKQTVLYSNQKRTRKSDCISNNNNKNYNDKEKPDSIYSEWFYSRIISKC